MKDRIISSLSYLTSGLVGFIWLIVSHIRHDRLSAFTRFHIFQSIFIFILIYVVGLVLNILLAIVKIMPIIGPLTVNIAYFLKDFPLILGFSIINFAIVALSVYLAFSAFMGRYGEVPGVSDTVRKM
ncbi:MAG: hypothetical protein A2Y25_08915 [Candidatus Melainabacteria bacterium GWF2_37_15]|nr:MAG: hypothetical protein A2Y25_08915 [Candidatus Melainabacteria bacterium GWF2_37_15]